MSYYFRKLGKIRQKFSSAAVVIGALRVKQMREKMTVVVDGGKRIDIDIFFPG